MTGKTCTDSSSALPLDARTARIASDGGLVASLHEGPAEDDKVQGGYRAGFEPDGLDSVAPRAAESRAASSLSIPVSSVRSTSHSDSNPT